MKKRILTIVAVSIMLTALLLTPSTYARYQDSKNYTFNVSSKTQLDNTTDSDVSYRADKQSTTITSKSKVFTLNHVGYYAIVAKGGDGSNGHKYYGLLTTDYNHGLSKYDGDGGIGGIVTGIYYNSTAGTKIYAAPGSAGYRAGTSATPKKDYGFGGVNATGSFFGGNGSYYSGTGESFSNYVSSGGGGAATVVCSGDRYNKSNILLVAGGGGACAVYDKGNEGIGVVDCFDKNTGYGGNGGTGTASNGTDSYFNGNDGTGGSEGSKTKTYTYGRGGTGSAGGAAGHVEKRTFWIVILLTVKANDGNAGLNFANGGNGGDSTYYGGAGGGGYCGGGSGTGTAIGVSSGGGGGGSSYASGSLYSLSNTVRDFMISSATDLPKQYSLGVQADDGDGYVIVMYLGTDLSKLPA